MRQHIVRGGWFGLGVLALMLGVHGHVLAGTAGPAPEIDGSSLSAGLGLLAGGRPHRSLTDAVEVTPKEKQQMRQHIVRGGWFGLSVLALMLGLHGHVLALTPVAAPEIDGSSLSAGLGLLAAGVLIVRSRMKSK